MKHSTIRSFNTLTTIAFAITLAVLGSWFLYNVSPVSNPISASAGTTDNLSGWAWSSGGIFKTVPVLGTINCDTDENGAVDSGSCGGNNSTSFASNSFGATLSGAGWVSFNCTNTNSCGTSNYGAHINESEKFDINGKGGITGSVWVGQYDNGANPVEGNPGVFGWMSFDRSKTGNPPPTQDDPGAGVPGSPLAYIDWSDGKIYGWARILSGCQDVLGSSPTSCTSRGTYPAAPYCPPGIAGTPIQTWKPGLANDICGNTADSWDGWVKLRSIVAPLYGVQLTNSNTITGYGWGGTGVGWIDFSANNSGNGVKFNPIATPPPAGCGIVNGVPTAIAPAANFCSNGAAPTSGPSSSAPATPYKWTWTCANPPNPLGVTCTAPFTQCSDGVDNDGDGQTDMTDPGCATASDNTERSFQFREF